MEPSGREFNISEIAITYDGLVIVCASEAVAQAACTEAIKRKYEAHTEGVTLFLHFKQM